MGKVKYPNPKFFKAKDRMDWAAQAENLKLVGGIFWDMFKETDWKKFGEGWKNILISDRDRIKEEYKSFAAASMKDKIDLILNGERHLGRLYRDGAMCTVRREWRGIKDTVYDFYEWARLWGMLLMSFSKDLIPAMNQTLYYRWMVSYFCCHSFMDKNILGLRGSNLRMSHELTYCIYRYVAENLVILAKGDRRNGNSEELNSKLVLIDEMTMAQIMAGFPTLYGIPHQLLPVFLVSEIDQLTCIPYIDAVESFGLPADTCPVPTSECGALVIDALPHLGSCYISSSMPCDGSVMASSYFSRRFPDIPVHHLCFPVRYEDELTLDAAVEDVKECIRFIEKQTGEKWNWDSYFTAMKRFNTETDYELQKWEINKTAYPQLIGPTYELFRKWCYEMDGGLDPRTIKSCEKVTRSSSRATRTRSRPGATRCATAPSPGAAPRTTTPTSPTGWPTAGASTSSLRWSPSTSPSTSTPPMRPRRCATWLVCTSAWSCAATPTAVITTSSPSCGVSARLGTPASSSCGSTSRARTWLPFRACSTSRAASWVCT